MKSQPSLPSIMVVSMCVSTTSACLWMRAARVSDDSAGVFFAGACAPSETRDSTPTTATAYLFSMLSLAPCTFAPHLAPCTLHLFILLEPRRHRDVRRRDIGRHLQHLAVHRHEG